MITKEQGQQVKSFVANYAVDGEKLVDKVAAGKKGGASTFWKKACDTFPAFKVEDWSNFLANMLEKNVAGLTAKVVEVEWDEATQTHIAKILLDSAEEVEQPASEQNPPDAPEPSQSENQSTEEPAPQEEMLIYPTAAESCELFAEIAEAVGGTIEGNFKGSIRTDLTDATEVDELAVRYYKTLKMHCVTATCTYRQLKAGNFSIQVSAGELRQVEPVVEQEPTEQEQPEENAIAA